VTTAGSLSDWAAKRVSMVQGWGPEGIKTVALGGLEGSLAALRTKQVDSLVLATEEGYQLEEKAEGRIVTNIGHYVKDFHTHVIFVRDELIAKDPDLVQRFVNGWFTTIAWMNANREKAIALSGKVLSLSPTVLAKTYDDEIGMMSDDGVFDPKALAVLKPTLVEMGILEKEPKDEEMFTTKFVPAKKIAFTPKL
jgi:ABC-type nitrate/sulfonate/bicarbonate transport system substrate-binding protein